jgi:hypothetical protein
MVPCETIICSGKHHLQTSLSAAQLTSAKGVLLFVGFDTSDNIALPLDLAEKIPPRIA